MMLRFRSAQVLRLLFVFVMSVYYVHDALAQEPQACVDDTCVRVEIMRTDEQLQRGLSGRERLMDDQGMLFDLGRDGQFSFWMKDMKFNLDIIWIDVEGRVVDLRENLLPCTKDDCPVYASQGNARYVLEVNAGFSQMHGIKSGSQIILKNFF